MLCDKQALLAPPQERSGEPTARNDTTICSLQLAMYKLLSLAVTEIFTLLPGSGSARTFVDVAGADAKRGVGILAGWES